MIPVPTHSQTGRGFHRLGMSVIAWFPSEEAARAAMNVLGPHLIDTLDVGIGEPTGGKTPLMVFEKPKILPFKNPRRESSDAG